MAEDKPVNIIDIHNRMVLRLSECITKEELMKLKYLFENDPLTRVEVCEIENVQTLFTRLGQHMFFEYGDYSNIVSKLESRPDLRSIIEYTEDICGISKQKDSGRHSHRDGRTQAATYRKDDQSKEKPKLCNTTPSASIAIKERDARNPPSSAKQEESKALRILMIGETGTGKSATGNTLIGENVFESKASWKSVTKECKDVQKKRFGKNLVVVDTPGFLDSNMSQNELMKHLVSCACLTCPGIHAFLLILRIGHRCINTDENAIESLKELFGERVLKRTVVVFTGKDTLDGDGKKLEDYISEQPETLRQMIAISNIGTLDGREQEARKIINKVEEVVRNNGGDSHYHTTSLSISISQMITENKKEILKKNDITNEKIRLIKQEQVRLYFEEQRMQENREQLQKNIDELQKELIDEFTAQKMAIEETRRRKNARLTTESTVVDITPFIRAFLSVIFR